MGLKSRDAPVQYKQSSRKSKRAWRKNIDLEDVERGLEKVREEEVQGGIIAEKSNDALFVVDTLGDERIAKKTKKKLKPLKIDEILNKRSAIEAPVQHIKSGMVTNGVLPSKRKKVMSKKELNRLKALVRKGDGNLKASAALNDKNTNANHGLYDVWDDNVHPESIIPVKRPKTLDHEPVKLVENVEQAPAVVVADPGMSYNPDAQAWMSLLERKGQEEAAKEQMRLEREKQEARVRLIAASKQEDFRVDIPDEDASSESEQEEKQKTSEVTLRDTPKRKTRAQRNKEKRRREQEREEQRLKQMQELEKQIEKAPEMATEIANLEPSSSSETLELVQKTTTTVVTELKVRKRRLGKHAIPEAPLELKLGDELSGSLRQLKPEGNLFVDRFRSAQARGLIPAAVPVSKRSRYKRKLKEKHSHKDLHKLKRTVLD
ncbi:rRNA processing protein Rrp16 [Schizosaccharomyces japonicus yFS275]|uniref:Ribosome biogenesis protein NOP53 n=1 Tax=Schizosaccharomyces japonicus (strain yFS275 / FY16936) TaxID=402676 RepID=B6JVB6_SCHJY|nr:rRNA processing protein Rrp16 [Schizosaccharomyces japonicus yFS275]EEB05317.1 rRNA processing protein Rrp16 [Schizosaccharomyces japonicus yFS275]